MPSLVSTFNISPHRLMQNIAQLSAIGALPNGGVQRIAFSTEDCQGRDLVRHWMQDAGLQVRVDPVGNLIGRYPGRFANAPALATGSHLDTVTNAGHYDGAYGVLAGLEVARTLKEHQQLLDHPFDIIVFADEERTMVGSKAISGNLGDDIEAYRSATGESIEHCLEKVGGNWAKRHSAQLTPADMAAFVELHVEQGPVLETAHKQIGIVAGIVGQRRYLLTVKGCSSHAGTTPMSLRQDALVAASRLVLAIHQIANQPGDQVATVGQLAVSPNVANTIPGQVELSLDIRDLDNDHLDHLMAQLQQEIVQIAADTGTRIQLVPRLCNQPALANSHIQNVIQQVCEQQTLSYLRLPSRASHDAQEMARVTDMGMIFVPSQSGVSHAETEYTSPAHCAQGANVLLHTLLALDKHYRCSEGEVLQA